MKRCFFFLMALLLFFVASPAFGAEVKKPAPKVNKAASSQETSSLETTYHALIIGNNQYKYLPRLKTARNDAIEVEKLLKEKYKFQTELVLDATRTNILGKINEMRKRLGEKDNLLIYYAGHGDYKRDVDKAYWLPIDAQRDDTTNWIIVDDITSNIKMIAARHILVVSDSCYSGTLARQALTELLTGERERYIKKMMDRPSRTLMASGGNEPVSDSGGGNKSIFADAFITSLKEIDKEAFTAEELFHSRIKEIVAGKSDQVPEYSNIKNSGHEGGDFVFKLASLGIEVIKPEVSKQDTKKETKQIEREQEKLAEERAKFEAERKRLEEQAKLVEERAKEFEEKARLEAQKREAEEQRKQQQEASEKLVAERTRLEMEQKRVVEEKKLEEAQKKKLEEEKEQLKELLPILPKYKITQPSPTDPPEVRVLLGRWIGEQGTLLIVTAIDISKKKANMIYAWTDRGWRTKKGYAFVVAEFIPGEKPIIKWGDGSKDPYHELVLEKDKLIGRWQLGSFRIDITYHQF